MSCSSRYAGTTTATVLPSSTSFDDRVPEQRGDTAEEQPDQRADRRGVAVAARGRLRRGGARQDPGGFDVAREGEQLLRLGRVALALRELDLEEELRVEGLLRVPDRRRQRLERGLVGGERVGERPDLRPRVRRQLAHEDLRELVRGRTRLRPLRTADGDLDERILAQLRGRGRDGRRIDAAAELRRRETDIVRDRLDHGFRP